MDYADEQQLIEEQGTNRSVSKEFSLEMARIVSPVRRDFGGDTVTVEQVKAEMEETEKRCTPCKL